jgi:hypothetical protein
MSALRRTFLLLAAMALMAAAARSHHAVEPFFDQDVDVEVRGIVERWIFRNPHPVLLLTAIDDDGEQVQWQVHFPPATVLAKRGWSAETFRPGDEVVATGHPSRRPGTHGLEYRGITRGDGSPVVPR